MFICANKTFNFDRIPKIPEILVYLLRTTTEKICIHLIMGGARSKNLGRPLATKFVLILYLIYEYNNYKININ